MSAYNASARKNCTSTTNKLNAIISVHVNVIVIMISSIMLFTTCATLKYGNNTILFIALYGQNHRNFLLNYVIVKINFFDVDRPCWGKFFRRFKS